jgi:hypothetical protein
VNDNPDEDFCVLLFVPVAFGHDPFEVFFGLVLISVHLNRDPGEIFSHGFYFNREPDFYVSE